MCGYIGGDTPHVWSASDWHTQTARYRLPIWVRSNPLAVNPNAGAVACAAALRVIGAPRGKLAAWDSEMSIDATWTRTFVGVLNMEGWPVIDYGSQSTVFGNDNPDGYYWGADWTDTQHLHSGDQMTQYVSYPAYDEDLAQASLPFWDTRPAPKGWTFPAPSGLHVVKQTREGYTFAWDAVKGPSGQKPTGYSACTYGAGGELVNHQIVAGLATSEYGPAGTGLPAGTYRTNVWANGGEVGPSHATVTVTLTR